MKVVAEKKVRKTTRYNPVDASSPLPTEENYWRYWAIFEDGSKEVIRKTATRAYVNAYRYDYQIASGPAKGSLSGFFSFGKNPSSYGGTPIANYVIEYPFEEASSFKVEVHTYGDGTVDGQPVWTGNGIEHETVEAAESAAKDLFGRWTAVKFWRVIDSNEVFRAGNQGDAS